MSHVERNRAVWDEWSAAYSEAGRLCWAAAEPSWGIWGVPESELGVLPDVVGKDVLELGCGTAYWSAWLARRGARAVGLDNSPKQLASATGFQREFGLPFPLVLASAEDVPADDASFDLVLSEYGASIWCDPYRWVSEAARLLRPGGDLVFLVNGTLLILCVPELEADFPATRELQRPYFGMYRFEWPDTDAVEFQLGYGDWIRLLRSSGFDVENLVEVRPPEGAPPNRWNLADPDWARRWPSEQIWVARKR